MSDLSSGAAGPRAHEWWRPTSSVAWVLVWLLGLQAVGQVVLIPLDSGRPFVRLHRGIDALVAGRDAVAQRWFDHAFDGSNRGVTQVVGLIGLGVTVAFSVWTWRSAKNANALGRVGARLAPGWAIAGWLIPGASLVLPYVMIQDLWRASGTRAAPGSEWRGLPGSTLVSTWWAVHVAGALLSFGAMGLAVAGKIDASRTETLLGIGHVIVAVGALLAILVVRGITERQQSQQAADPAPTTRVAAVATVDGPGWYPDPGKRHDQRYWDGSAWTEHVSTAGQASTAPVLPPDWYPDPTGRFHWRYWTGHAWTEHVSRDEQLFVDPVDDGAS